METGEILKRLCTASGISGCESAVIDIFEDIAGEYLGKAHGDALGNRWYKRAEYAGKTLMIEAHSDKIGLMLSHITDNGYLLFSEVGGYDKKLLPASRVVIHGREDMYGVIGSVPPHLRKKQESMKDSLAVDAGFDRENAKEHMRVGDFIELDTEYTPLAGTRVAASALDDRAGLAAVARVLELLGDDFGGVMPCISVQEEVGCRGAKTAAYNANPDMYVCIDVCHGTTPDASYNTFPLGKGPVITVGPNVQPFMSRRLVETAKEKGIPYQIDVDSGNTGTNAWPVQVSGKGIPTALVSIPLRYMHTCYEVADIEDIENTARLLAEFAKIAVLTEDI